MPSPASFTLPRFARVEPLERRQLLAGLTTDGGLNGPAFSLNVNFQASGSVPGGFVADNGLTFSDDRGFGWQESNTADVRTRETSLAKKFDTFARFEPGEVWEAEVPDGLYRVYAVAGDPVSPNATLNVRVEGRSLLAGTVNGGAPLMEGSVLMEVSDGRLTLTAGGSASNNKINFLQIERLGGLFAAGAPLRINYQPDGVATPAGYFADTGSAFADRGNGLTYGWDQANIYAVDRELFGDQRFDTLLFTQADGNRQWELAVEPGMYEVFVVAGDPKLSNSRYEFLVEGETLLTGAPAASGAARWVGGTRQVSVTDGRLTLQAGLRADNNKINYIEVRRLKGLAGQGVSFSEKATGFRQVQGLPTPRYEAQVVELGGEILFFGGFDDDQYAATRRVDAYDPALDAYTRLADLPTKLTHAQTVLVNDEVWLIGGFVGDLQGPATDSVWIYNRQTNTYRLGPTLPIANGAGGAALDGNIIHYLGGQQRTADGTITGVDLGHHYFYDLAAPERGWVRTLDIPAPNNHFALVKVGAALYQIGGQSGGDEWGTNRDSVWRYDLRTGDWSQLPDMPAMRGHVNESTFVEGGRIFVVGGSGPAPFPENNAEDDVWTFDIATGTWTYLFDLVERRKNPVARIVDGKLVVLGGGTTAGPHAEVYQVPVLGAWQRGPDLPVALGETSGGVIGDTLYLVGDGDDRVFAYDLRQGIWQDRAPRPVGGKDQVTHVINDKLYVFGGVDYSSGSQIVLDAVQIFDPATNIWTRGTDMPYGSLASQSAQIDGYVYLAGGIVAGNDTTRRVVRYDISADAFEELGPMPTPRDSGAAGTDGRYLWIFGGRAGGDAPGNGFNDTYAYDTRYGLWYSSSDSGLARLPQRRGGVSRAPYIDGKFYVVGGETGQDYSATGPDGLYDRVDIFDPSTNTWTPGPPLPTDRHGIGPIFHNDRLYVIGGGDEQGQSESRVMEVLNLFQPTAS